MRATLAVIIESSATRVISGQSATFFARARNWRKENKRRHDNVARAIYWDLSRKCAFQRNERWYDHVSESVIENVDYKLL